MRTRVDGPRPLAWASFAKAEKVSSSRRSVMPFVIRGRTNFTASPSSNSSSNSALSCESQKPAASATDLKRGIRLLGIGLESAFLGFVMLRDYAFSKSLCLSALHLHFPEFG